MKVFNQTTGDITIQGVTIESGDFYAVPVASQVAWAKDPFLRASMNSSVATVGWLDASDAEVQFAGDGGMDMLRALAAGTMMPQDQTEE